MSPNLMKSFVIFLMIVCILWGCGSIDLCESEIGDVIEITAFDSGWTHSFDTDLEGCEVNAIYRIIGNPIFLTPGDVVRLEIVRVNSRYSYDVLVLSIR